MRITGRIWLKGLLIAAVAIFLALSLPGESGDKVETNQPPAVSREKVPSAAPGDAPKESLAKKGALSPEEQKRVDAGKSVYEAVCLACHQQNGLGQEGVAPPLAGSEWVAGTPERMVRIILSGMRGPIHVKKQTFELEMPSLGVLDDQEIANVVSYVRHEWGHNFSSVSAAEVKRIRAATDKHDEAWTEEELKKVQ